MKQVLELLNEGAYTIVELAERTGFSIYNVRYYVSRLVKMGQVTQAGTALARGDQPAKVWAVAGKQELIKLRAPVADHDESPCVFTGEFPRVRLRLTTLDVFGMRGSAL